jgi:hypothetical protein
VGGRQLRYAQTPGHLRSAHPIPKGNLRGPFSKALHITLLGVPDPSRSPGRTAARCGLPAPENPPTLQKTLCARGWSSQAVLDPRAMPGRKYPFRLLPHQLWFRQSVGQVRAGGVLRPLESHAAGTREAAVLTVWGAGGGTPSRKGAPPLKEERPARARGARWTHHSRFQYAWGS